MSDLESDVAGDESNAGIVIVVLLGLAVFLIYCSIIVVKEKQVVVLQRCGRFHRVLDPNIHLTIPFFDRPRKYSWRFYETSSTGGVKLVNKSNQYIVSTKTEVMDFPKQDVISRDNARVTLDAILNYKITNPKRMLYRTQKSTLHALKTFAGTDSQRKFPHHFLFQFTTPASTTERTACV